MFDAARRAVVSNRSAELFAKQWFDITVLEAILRAAGRKMTAAQYAHLRPLHCAHWAQMGEGEQEVRSYVLGLIWDDCPDCRRLFGIAHCECQE